MLPQTSDHYCLFLTAQMTATSWEEFPRNAVVSKYKTKKIRVLLNRGRELGFSLRLKPSLQKLNPLKVLDVFQLNNQIITNMYCYHCSFYSILNLVLPSSRIKICSLLSFNLSRDWAPTTFLARRAWANYSNNYEWPQSTLVTVSGWRNRGLEYCKNKSLENFQKKIKTLNKASKSFL